LRCAAGVAALLAFMICGFLAIVPGLLGELAAQERAGAPDAPGAPR
jgi:hypothetical protein